MRRADVEQRLLHRHPDLPAGIVVAAVGQAVRRLTGRSDARADVPWSEVEQTADEQLLLRQALRRNRG